MQNTNKGEYYHIQSNTKKKKIQIRKPNTIRFISNRMIRTTIGRTITIRDTNKKEEEDYKEEEEDEYEDGK